MPLTHWAGDMKHQMYVLVWWGCVVYNKKRTACVCVLFSDENFVCASFSFDLCCVSWRERDTGVVTEWCARITLMLVAYCFLFFFFAFARANASPYKW